jgi:electron transport complex protein RnfG
MRDFLNLTLKLFIVCVISAGLLGATYNITKEPIAQQAVLASTAANQAVFPDADTFNEQNVADYQGKPGWTDAFANVTTVLEAQKGGETVGYVVKVVSSGYGGDIGMTVGIGLDGKYTGVNIDSMSETPGLGDNAKKDEFKGQYTGKSSAGALNVIKTGTAGDSDIQAIAGATITSRAVTDGINVAGQFAQAMLLAE